MNILFVTADQWRGECLSALGHPVVKTPHLDSLAREGALFRQHYAQATPCAPSRTSMHTGMYMSNHRCVNNGTPVDSRLNNWALEVRAAGYDPSLFGYSDTAPDPRGLNEDDPRLTHYSEPLPGIGRYTPLKEDVSVGWIDSLRAKGYPIPDTPKNLHADTIEGTEWEDGGDVPLPLAMKTEDHETHYMVDECIDWIEKQQKPWITHLSLLRPHGPFVAPEPYNQLYNPATLAAPERPDAVEQEGQQHPFLDYCLKQEKFRAPESDRVIQRMTASYYGLMTEVDANLGRLFDSLRLGGQWDSTLIIFCSDHGEQMGDHWLMGKLGYFDQSYYIPLIIRDPRQVADPGRGKQFDAFTENVDLMPTMLDWLGLDIPAQCDGQSLLPMMHTGETPKSWRSEAHWEFDFRKLYQVPTDGAFDFGAHQSSLSVIRDRLYKYVHFTALSPLLFDLQQDPHETVNLADKPEYQSILLEYAQKMLSWRMKHTDRAMTEVTLTEQGPVTIRSPL
jgi:arylsulfatase A-like enzyme